MMKADFNYVFALLWLGFSCVALGNDLDDDLSERQIIATFHLQAAPPMRRAGRSHSVYGNTKQYRQSIFDDQKAIRLARRYNLKKIAEWPIKVLNVHCVVYQVANDESVDQALERIAKDKSIESVQAMTVFKVQSNNYNDPYLKLQHNLKSLQVPLAHSVSMGRGIKLAVVDSGVDLDHPEFKDKIQISKNFVDQQLQTFKRDIHGTAVTGVIASAVNNGIGIIGVAPEVDIWALKACWQLKPSLSAAVCNSLTLTQAISYAIDEGADILNLSLSGPEDRLVKRIIEAALQRNMIVVSAYDENNHFPASVDQVIAVSGSKESQHSIEEVETKSILRYFLKAPGTDILTTLPDGHYDYISGSSFAAAHISGLIALLLEQNRNLTVEQVYKLLDNSRKPIINACSALQALLAKKVCPPKALQ